MRAAAFDASASGQDGGLSGVRHVNHQDAPIFGVANRSSHWHLWQFRRRLCPITKLLLRQRESVFRGHVASDYQNRIVRALELRVNSDHVTTPDAAQSFRP